MSESTSVPNSSSFLLSSCCFWMHIYFFLAHCRFRVTDFQDSYLHNFSTSVFPMGNCKSFIDLWFQNQIRSDQFHLFVNTKKIDGPSWHSRNLGPLHMTIKLVQSINVGVQNARHEVTIVLGKLIYMGAWRRLYPVDLTLGKNRLWTCPGLDIIDLKRLLSAFEAISAN